MDDKGDDPFEKGLESVPTVETYGEVRVDRTVVGLLREGVAGVKRSEGVREDEGPHRESGKTKGLRCRNK